MVNATLDELTRSAIDGGLGSTRCELIAEALVNMSSVEVKGKLLARLRRVSKTYLKYSHRLNVPY